MEGQRESSLPGRAESVSMKSSWGCRGSRNAPSDWRVSGANTLTSDQSTIRLHGVNGLDAWVTPLAGGIQQGRAAGPFGKRVVLQRTACAPPNLPTSPDQPPVNAPHMTQALTSPAFRRHQPPFPQAQP